jgi:hypothetical protein
LHVYKSPAIYLIKLGTFLNDRKVAALKKQQEEGSRLVSQNNNEQLIHCGSVSVLSLSMRELIELNE